jgi:hypothetical protein
MITSSEGNRFLRALMREVFREGAAKVSTADLMECSGAENMTDNLRRLLVGLFYEEQGPREANAGWGLQMFDIGDLTVFTLLSPPEMRETWSEILTDQFPVDPKTGRIADEGMEWALDPAKWSR